MFCRKCKKEIPEGSAFCCWCGTKQTAVRPPVKTRGNGTGTVYKRGKTWEIQVTLGFRYDAETGKLKRIARTKGGFKTKTDALNYVQTLKTQSEQKQIPLLADYWESYSSHEMEKLSDNKRLSYKIAWDKLKELHYRRIDTITVGELREIVSTKAPTYYPARDMKIVLSHLFKLAGADRVADKDLPSFIDLPVNAEKEKETFTEEEQALLWKSWDGGDKNAAIPLILIYTGMMPGELNDMDVSMIDLPNRKITNAGKKTEIRKKLSILLPDDICPVIEEISENVTGKLYPMHKTSFYKAYYAALERAGITRHLSPYCCRHTTSTRHAIDENTPPEILARIMRWSSSRMADRYVHPSDKDALNAVNELRKSEINA